MNPPAFDSSLFGDFEGLFALLSLELNLFLYDAGLSPETNLEAEGDLMNF